jgi:hypothetical protein
MSYEHVQHGYIGVATVVFMLVVGLATLPETFNESAGAGWAVIAMFVVIAGVTVWFSWLKVAVEDATLTAAFGPGRPRKRVDLSDVVSALPARNQWYQGLGVRKISGGWMYNVWGLDAVEFTMTSGEIVRIGTNDLDNLLASVRVFTG